MVRCRKLLALCSVCLAAALSACGGSDDAGLKETDDTDAGQPSTGGASSSPDGGPGVASCENSLDCADNADGRTVCNGGNGTCVECVAAADCGPDNDCIANECVPYVSCDNSLDCELGQVCDASSGRCVECLGDADCEGSSACGSDVCAGNVCRPCCDSDNDCTPQGLLCDRAAGHCSECVLSTDCGSGQTCTAGKCEAVCVPTTCAAEGSECGTISDGCGAELDCGTCTPPESCSTSNVCTCASSVTCASGDCGPLSDGCGGFVECGDCTSPDVCGGGGPSRCGPNPPEPTTCEAEGKNCGSVPDGIGGTLECGPCTPPESCGGGGIANVCGCTPTPCGSQCGSVSNGCGGTIDCPACPTCSDGIQNGNETGVDCGGSCPACLPGTCADGVQNGNETGVDCGGSCLLCVGAACTAGTQCASSSCPGTLCSFIMNCTCAAPSCSDGVRNGNETDVDCGGSCATGCEPGDSCVVNGDCDRGPCTAGICGCTPRTSASCIVGTECGTLSDGCGGTITCPGCAPGSVCYSGACCLPASEGDCRPGVDCGNVSDGCGGTIDCGGCLQGYTCRSNQCCELQFTLADCVASVDCGAVPDGCGGTVPCGGCNSGEVCGGGGANKCGSSNYTQCSSAADCAANVECVTFSGTSGSVGVCTPGCTVAADCPSGPGGARPSCNPSGHCVFTCATFITSCPSGMTCSGSFGLQGVCYLP